MLKTLLFGLYQVIFLILILMKLFSSFLIILKKSFSHIFNFLIEQKHFFLVSLPFLSETQTSILLCLY